MANDRAIIISEYSSPLTTKGDIFTYDTAEARLPVILLGLLLVQEIYIIVLMIMMKVMSK